VILVGLSRNRTRSQVIPARVGLNRVGQGMMRVARLALGLAGMAVGFRPMAKIENRIVFNFPNLFIKANQFEFK
jgi:hypothetical protein